MMSDPDSLYKIIYIILSLYAVVEFDEFVNKKKCVELLPISWLLHDNSRCYYPPKREYDKIEDWVKNLKDPKKNWSTYPIEIIAEAKDYEQGQRRLKRSLKKNAVNSSDSESQQLRDSEPLLLDSAGVSKSLLQTKPLARTEGNAQEMISENDSNFIAGSSQPQMISFIEAIEDLKQFFKREINNAKRSILYDLEEKINTIKIELSQRTGEIAPPEPWKIIGGLLPAMELEKFLEFDEQLITDTEKKEALIQIFRLETIGSTNYEADIKKILKKLIGKDVQLLYSGCGRMSNGVGKKNFSTTQFFKIMNDFLLSKYIQSTEKLKIIQTTSKFLTGAKDREGGRSQRFKKD